MGRCASPCSDHNSDPSSDGSCGELSCGERLERVQGHIERWSERAGRCERDSDCTFISTSTGCQGTCGTYVNRAFARILSRKLAQLDERVCSSYIEDGCAYSTPSCMQQRGACIEGQCTGVRVELPVGAAN
jgi:hypothetical protein